MNSDEPSGNDAEVGLPESMALVVFRLERDAALYTDSGGYSITR